MLGPVLERVANEADSGFVLAKLNSDQNQGLAQQYGIRGIPAVKAFANGRVVDEFVGAQPEQMVRQFVGRVKSGFKPAATASTAKRTTAPADPSEWLNQARQLLSQGSGCKAQSLLEDFPPGPQAAEVGQLFLLAKFMCSGGQELGGSADLQALYGQAASAMQRREVSAALYNLLVALNQEAEGRKAGTRRVMQSIFVLLGEGDRLVQQYQPLI